MSKILLPWTGSVGCAWFDYRLDDDGHRKITSLGLKISRRDDGFVFEGGFVFKDPIELDLSAVIEDCGETDTCCDKNAGDKKFKTRDAILNEQEEAIKRRATAALDELRGHLRKVEILVDGSAETGVTADFLGIKGIANGKFEATLKINPPGLWADDTDDRPIFAARASASFEGGFTSKFVTRKLNASVMISVELDREGVLNLLPSVGIPDAPHLNLDFPKFALPKWSLADLTFEKFDNMEFLRFPLRADEFVKTDWTPKPSLKFSVVEGQQLAVSMPPTDLIVYVKIGDDWESVLEATSVSLAVENGKVVIDVQSVVTTPRIVSPGDLDLSDGLPGPFVVEWLDPEIKLNVTYGNPGLALTVETTINRLQISARNDPSLRLVAYAKFSLKYDGTTVTPKIETLKILDPTPIDLALIAARYIADGAGKLLSLIQAIDVPEVNAPGTPDLPSLESFLTLLRRIGAMLAAAMAWFAEQGETAARALAGLAEAAIKLIAELVTVLAEALAEAGKAIAERIVVEIRVDPTTLKIAQIVVTPLNGKSTEPFDREFLGLKLNIPYGFSPALIIDLRDEWAALTLQPDPDFQPDPPKKPVITLSTDLWLSHDQSKVTEPVTSADSAGGPKEPLMALKFTPKKKFALAIVTLERGKANFLKKIRTQGSPDDIQSPGGTEIVKKGHLLVAAAVDGLESIGSDDFEIDVVLEKNRILSLFRAPASTAKPASGGLDQFSQYLKVESCTVQKPIQPPKLGLNLTVRLKVSKEEIETAIGLTLDLDDLSANITGGRLDIKPKSEDFELFGLHGKFDRKLKKVAPLFLDFGDGDPRLGLNENVALKLSYDKVSSDGRGLTFEVDRFVVSRDGVDLSAEVDKRNPVTLAGVDMPFRFDHGSLAINRSRIQSFGIGGYGNLPPALVGEAKAKIILNFTERDGDLHLQAATAVLDKSADPLRCESTQFNITVTKLGLKFVEQGGYHFYFTLTGAAEFRPNNRALSNGLLKNLSSARIVLDEAPLASDPRVLLKHIEFQVTVEPPGRTNFFDLFAFEVRGVGFHPAAPAFGGDPAFSLSGQVNFTDFGDVVKPRFDFHKMWIAAPKPGDPFPRIRFDGLGVGLTLGSMAEVSGTAYAVDENLPTLFSPDVLPDDVTANGFLAAGSLRIQGWASMSASMGFLELEKEERDEKRIAFFLYVQRNDLSEKIPTPIGTFFLREVGFGFGYRYTLAGIEAADQTESPRELVKMLDEVSKYQGSLHDVKAWWPTYENSALTLALRGLFSMTSVSTNEKYNDKKEKELPNLVLFDIVAALRTDLTFLMNVRAWVAFNYNDWREATRSKAAWTTHPGLHGYMYLSAPRREFLARAVHDPSAQIGDHPKLPDQLKQAMKRVRWSSTLYVRPGLFHMELGWPYELGFDLGDPKGNFYLKVEGGTVLRVEDSAILYGLAFRASGFVLFAYSTGGSFGASVEARADFALGTKLIAYLSQHINESMFYGTIVLDISVEFAIRMWLKLRFCNLSDSFSRSLTIHVGIELLLQPGGVAAHVEASVSVGAFGRSLTLGIGFGLGNQGQLAAARARVERFLALGLGASYPNPETGAPMQRPAPLPEPSRESNARRSDDRVERSADRRQVSAPDPEPVGDPPPVIGKGFHPVKYWALIFPIKLKGKEPYYLVQLLPMGDEPMDEQHCGKTNDDLSYFYAAPLNQEHPGPTGKATKTWSYLVAGVQEDEILAPKNSVVESGTGFRIKSNWTALFGLNGDANAENARTRPNLWEVFDAACFLGPGKADGKDYQRTDIKSIPWAEGVPLPEDPQQASIALARAARSRAECGFRTKRMIQVEEARSSFIATVADCAERLAALYQAKGRKLSEADTDALEFDPRAIGLTFLFSKKRLEEDLFPDVRSSGGTPVSSTAFTVKTRMPTARGSMAKEQPVLLFNPPSRMFHARPPALRKTELKPKVTGMALSWDLEAPWAGNATGSYGDPEFHLKHYRVERRIEGVTVAAGLLKVPPPRQFQVKRAEHVEWLVPEKESRLHRRRLYSNLQLVDDMQDLPQALRALLLPAALPSESRASGKTQVTNARVVYSIQPIDVANTAGTTEVLVWNESAPEPQQQNVLKAIARFNYAELPTFNESTADPTLEMTLEEPEQSPPEKASDEDTKPILRDQTDLQLRIRTERTVAVGVFGADALSQARTEPAVPARDEEKGVNDCEVTLSKDRGQKTITITRIPRRTKARTTPGQIPEGEAKSLKYSVSQDDWDSIKGALDIGNTALVSAARLYIRPAPIKDSPEHLWPDWVPVQIQLRVSSKDPSDEPAVDTTIERFEHPIAIDFEALTSHNLFPASGGLHGYYPKPGTQLENLVNGTEDCVSLLPDGERRTGVRIAWNARPSDLKAVKTSASGTGLTSLIGGYDLFAVDATAVPKRLDDTGNEIPILAEELAHYAKPLGRVQRLASTERGQEPSETGDLAQVEVHYPSETWRLNPDHRNTSPRALWYSPAESFLVWPVRILRRSVLTLPDEIDIERMFARHRPEKITIEWKNWPTKEKWKKLKPKFAFRHGGTQVPQPEGGFTPQCQGQEGRHFGVEEARNLLLGLVFENTDNILVKLDELIAQSPETLQEVAISVRIDDGIQNSVLDPIEIPVSLTPTLHPLLEDTLELLRYETSNGTTYRRYEPVLEPAPPVNATSLTGFLDETGPDIDPAGWGVLRTLGLAVALRLYDTERGEFVAPKKTVGLVNAALDKVLPRYPVDKIGAPFVDVMFTADGLTELASFDGAAPSAAGAAEMLRDNRALALVQIELRPVVQALAQTPGDYRVRYGTILVKESNKESENEESIKLISNNTGDSRYLIEIEPLTPTKGRSRKRVLLRHGWTGEEFPPFSNGSDAAGEPVEAAVTFEDQAENTQLANFRIVALDNKAVSIDEVKGLSDRVSLELESESVYAYPAQCKGPWGRFADLSDSWLAALLFSDGLQEKSLSPASFVPSNSQAGTLVALMDWLPRSDDPKNEITNIPEDPKKRLELVGRLNAWSRRFMEQGPASKVTPEKAALALAMLTRPNPWRLAPGSDGRLSVLLLEKNRFGKMRKYAVRPFGRYENLANAVVAQDGTSASRATMLDAASLGADNPARTRFADVTVERTEPLAAPVLVAHRTTDPADDGSGINRRNELVLWRHPEEVFSDANIPVDAGLAMRHVAVGFWREFAAPQWAEAVLEVTQGHGGPESFELMEKFGPFLGRGRDYCKLPKPNAGSSFNDEFIPVTDLDVSDLRDYYERYPDLWQGAYILRLGELPYGFRFHATAHAAAGVVVSPPAVASLGGASYRVHLPWFNSGATKCWQDTALPKPGWRLVESTSNANVYDLEVRWPAVRLVDSMLACSRRVWFEKEPAPRLYMLPDPGVSYRLSIATQDGRVRVGEVEIGAISKDADERNALYLPQKIGTRFDAPVQKTVYSPGNEQVPEHYELSVRLAPQGSAPEPPEPETKPSFNPRPINELKLEPTDLQLSTDEMKSWSWIAPEAVASGTNHTLKLTITPPERIPIPGLSNVWGDFIDEVVEFLNGIKAHSHQDIRQQVRSVTMAVHRLVEPYSRHSPASWPNKTGSFPNERYRPITVDTPWVIGLPIKGNAISIAEPAGGWAWPENPTSGNEDELLRKKLPELLNEAIRRSSDDARVRLQGLKQAVDDPVRKLMAWWIACRRRDDDLPILGLPAIRRKLPEGFDSTKLQERLPEAIDFSAGVSLEEGDIRNQLKVQEAFIALQAVPNSADTLEDLAALWEDTLRAARIRVRWSSKETIAKALKPLSESPAQPMCDTVILRAPIPTVITASFARAHVELPCLLDRMTEEILFGPRRRLLLQALHGVAKPKEDGVQRDEPRNCPEDQK